MDDYEDEEALIELDFVYPNDDEVLAEEEE